MSIFDEINQLPEEAIIDAAGLKPAGDKKSYVCPECGNGGGKRGDGIKQRQGRSRLNWWCPSCEKNFSNVDLIAAVEGIDPTDSAELAKRLGELFPAYVDDNFFSFQGDKSAWREMTDLEKVETLKKMQSDKENQKETVVESAPRNFSGFYDHCRKNYSLKEFVEDQGGAWRGLTYETLSEAGCVYHAEYMIGDNEKCPVVIIPYGDDLYFWREVGGTRRGVPKGAKRRLYEAEQVKMGAPSLNFIVEGELDALSIKQSTKSLFEYFGVIATGSAAFSRMTVEELEKRFGKSEEKPCFVVMFDNDKAGMAQSHKLVNELRAAGYPTEEFFLERQMAGEYETTDSSGDTKRETCLKVDANDLLQKAGEKALLSRLIGADEELSHRLQEQSEAMKMSRIKAAQVIEQERVVAENKSGMKLFSFPEYFSAEFFADIELAAKYSTRKTGFENIDEAQIFLPGLYVLGGLPGSGKTTFAWQLLNQLADRGEFCIYCSYEMSHFELLSKSMARELYKRNASESERLNLSSANIRRGALRGSDELMSQAAIFAKSNVNLKVAELSNMTAAELTEELRAILRGNLNSPVVCIDYLQIMPSSRSNKSASAKEKVDDVMLRLKDFQRETNSTVIVISSFNRDNYFKEASFSSFKESGAIEYSADVIWGLENHGVDAEGNLNRDEMIKMSREKVREIKLSCLKNRNGGAYECEFRYYATHDYFEPLKEEKSCGRCSRHER